MVKRILNAILGWFRKQFSPKTPSVQTPEVSLTLDLRTCAKELNLAQVDLRNPTLVAAHLKARYPDVNTFHLKDK